MKIVDGASRSKRKVVLLGRLYLFIEKCIVLNSFARFFGSVPVAGSLFCGDRCSVEDTPRSVGTSVLHGTKWTASLVTLYYCI